MLKKGSKLYSIIFTKCPRCHEGDMFSSSVFSTRFMAMNKNCPVCGFDFIQEPSYYFGAMYFSYAISAIIFVGVYLVLRYTIDPGVWSYVIWTIITSIIILPFNFRISRAAWINLFFSYNKDQVKHK
jgi:uncharacterized protein (DUF983 family)